MTHAPGNAAPSERQFVKFSFYKVDAAWRRLPARARDEARQAFIDAIERMHGRMLVRTYSLVGIRGDCDFLLWQTAASIDLFQRLATSILNTPLGAYLEQPYSFLSMTRRSIYEIRDEIVGEKRSPIRPAVSKYLFVYPFVKTREWYALSREARQEYMDEHIRIGRRFPGVQVNTTYSYGLDDQEFVVAFEGDDPGVFLDLVMALRESVSSRYTLRDTPSFTCLQMSLDELIDALGGAPGEVSAARSDAGTDEFVAVASIADLPDGAARRVYVDGEAVALFNAGGALYAVSNRCSHARGPLCEGTVDCDALTVTCPWHTGRFDLRTGAAVSAPATAGVPVYRTRVADGTVFVSRIAEPPASPFPGEGVASAAPATEVYPTASTHTSSPTRSHETAAPSDPVHPAAPAQLR